MKNMLLLAAVLTFVASIAIGPIVLPILRRIKAGQTVRDDGPQSHLKKNGTPTMGAFIYLIPATVFCLIYAKESPKMLSILLLTLGFAAIGFIDDFIKVVLKRSLGLKAWQKLVLQFVVSALFIWYMKASGAFPAESYIPFAAGKTVNLGWFSIPLAFVVLLGTSNGSNFTDGIDGLEATVTAAILSFFLMAAIILDDKIAVMPAIFIGGLLGYLMFNVSKALVFMGDTGSLALGGLVAGIAYALGLELYIPIVAGIYLAEVISVILQVGYFKLTHGKRIFRMAPLHHHFELGGWEEAKVVAVFSTVTLVLGAIALIFII